MNYAKYSDEKFLNDILACIIDTGNVIARNGDTLYFDKSYTSKIMNNRVGIPSRILETAMDEKLLPAIAQAFSLFYKDHINRNRTNDMRKTLSNILSADTVFTPAEKADLLSVSDSEQFLFALFMKTLLVNNDTAIKSGTPVWSKGNSYIQAVKGNIFSYAFSDRRQRKTIIVIPVNTRFDVHLTTKLENTVCPMVSSETIHGEWILRVERQKGRIDDIPERIQNDLRSRGCICNDNGEYPIGTIAAVDIGNTCFYLLAISSFDKQNHAKSNPQLINKAVNSLLDFYDINGQGYEMYLPLLGTGRSRAGMSSQESFDLIKTEALNRADSFNGKIVIVVSKDNKEEISIGGNML